MTGSITSARMTSTSRADRTGPTCALPIPEKAIPTRWRMNRLIPSHVVFNGRVGALTGDRALEAEQGETVLFIHSQANRDSRPHLIGGHGDLVWESGKFNNPPERDLETWFIRGGSAGAALYTFLQPGVYAYVNHNLIEAVNLGATAHVIVGGNWNNDLMEQVVAPSEYDVLHEGRTALP